VHDWVGPLILVAVGWSAWRARARDRWLARELARFPDATIAELKEGQRVRVTGTVEATGAPLSAPYSGRACLAWCTRDVARDSLHERLVRFAAGDFVLRGDDGGRILVRASEAELVVTMGHPISVERVGGAAVRRESVLQPGEHVTVVGAPRQEPDPTGIGSYREPPMRLVFGAGVWILSGASASQVGVRGKW
jgi:hypothetical protein